MGDEQRKGPGLDKNPSAWWRRLVDLGAFFAVPPAVAYVLGLIAFWMQLSVAYTFSEAWTTWYAAILAPKLLIVGIGIAVIGRAISLAITLAWILLVIAKHRTAKEDRPEPQRDLTTAMVYRILPTMMLLLALDLVLVTFLSQSFNTDFGLRFALIPVVLLYTLFVYFQFRQGSGFSHIKAVLSYFPRWSLETPLIAFLLLLVVFTFYPTDVSTPCFTNRPYEEPENARDNSFPTGQQGRLIAHTDGYWYVFDRRGDLLAIPDAERDSVEISGAFYDSQPPLPFRLAGRGLVWIIPGLEDSSDQNTPSSAEVENNPSAPVSEACF